MLVQEDFKIHHIFLASLLIHHFRKCLPYGMVNIKLVTFSLCLNTCTVDSHIFSLFVAHIAFFPLVDHLDAISKIFIKSAQRLWHSPASAPFTVHPKTE